MSTTQIPKTLPRSTLACPPSKGYCEPYMKAPVNNQNSSQIKISTQFK
jgi:hypothetical protein